LVRDQVVTIEQPFRYEQEGQKQILFCGAGSFSGAVFLLIITRQHPLKRGIPISTRLAQDNLD
jgi:hypothetical protein